MAIQNTPRLALPYPDGNDPVTAGDNRIQDLATAIDDVMATDDQGTVGARPAAGTPGRYYYATDQRVLYRDRGTGWDAVAFDPKRGLFSAYKNTGQIISGGGSDFLTFTVQEDDPNNAWNDSSSFYTAPLTGHYEFGAHITVTGVGADVYMTILLETVAGVQLRELDRRRTRTVGESVHLSASTQIRLTAGDQIRLRFINGDTSARTVYGGGSPYDSSRFWGRLVAVNLDT